MNLFFSLIIYILNIFCACEYLQIDPVCLIEHNFWEAHTKTAEPGKGFLYSVKIASDNKEYAPLFFDYFGDLFYYDNDNNLNYAIVKDQTVTNVLYNLVSSENDIKYIRFEFFYTEKSFDEVRRLGIDTRQTKWYKNFKILKRTPYRTLEFTNDDENNMTRMHHVHDRFNKLIASNLLILNSRIINEDFSRCTKYTGFELYYFKNHTDCFNGLKEFLVTIRHLILVDDMTVRITYKSFEDMQSELNFLKMSYFMNYLTEKFEKNFTESNEDPETKQSFKTFFITACEYIKDELLNNKIFLPLGGQYTNEYHLDKLYKIILENISKSQGNCTTHDLSQLCCQKFQTDIIKAVIEKQEEITLTDIIARNYILVYFSNFLKKDVNTLRNFVEIEKIVCDFFNMVKYLSKTFNVQCFKNDHLYTKPIYIDDYECRIIEGIDIKFPFSLNPGTIKAYDREGKEILLKQLYDYVYNLKFCSLFISFETIYIKNIYEIEVISPKKEIIERFKPEEFYIN